MFVTIQSVRTSLFDLVEHRSTADGCLIVIHRRGRPEESQSIARNYAIIRTLQTEVEGRLAARPGVYDGRKSLFTSFNLESESDGHEASQSYHCSSPSSIFPHFSVCSAHE
jgi:hypothetical protein